MIKFNNTYSNLPSSFYSPAKALRAPQPELLSFNKDLAKSLGLELEEVDQNRLAKLFTGQEIPEEASAIALAYAGHQFGQRAPLLGDGRAFLLGEVVDPQGKRFDIHLKGSGRTAYSRSGDGRSSLGPVIREYIVSEAMYHLGVPTTRSLAACKTGEPVFREETLPGGMLTRVASSHIRFGTFELAANMGDVGALKELADYSIDRHYPLAKTSEAPYLAFIEMVATAQAKLVAKWTSLGFIHGVMNTDNMSIAGETIDYGPCAFMDNFKRNRVFSSIDRFGRYAYDNQIKIAKWNLAKFASCFIPLIDENQEKAINILEDSINSYIDIYDQEWLKQMALKLGINDSQPSDVTLIEEWLSYLEVEDMDFTLSYRMLADPDSALAKSSRLTSFYKKWLERSPDREAMNKVNPLFIPRNHLVEKAILEAYSDDFSLFHRMIEVLKRPYTHQPENEELARPPKPEERIRATFCGT